MLLWQRHRQWYIQQLVGASIVRHVAEEQPAVVVDPAYEPCANGDGGVHTRPLWQRAAVVVRDGQPHDLPALAAGPDLAGLGHVELVPRVELCYKAHFDMKTEFGQQFFLFFPDNIFR